MARGGYGIPKVSPKPAMYNPSTPYERATPETALRPFQRWPHRRAGGLRPSSTPFGHPTPYAYGARRCLVMESSFIGCLPTFLRFSHSFFCAISWVFHKMGKVVPLGLFLALIPLTRTTQRPRLQASMEIPEITTFSKSNQFTLFLFT
jgi:hypothetical protein